MPVAQLASRLTPRGWLIVGGAAVAAILFIYLFLHMVSAAELHDARQRRRPLPDGQDDEHAQRARRQLPAAEQRHRDRGAVQPDRRRRASRWPAPACSATPSPASHCSTNRASAKATSSSRSPTSARCRASSKRRSTASRASPARRSSSCCRTPRTRSSAKARAPPRPRCCCRARRSLDPSSVRGIAQLVASSVPGLQLSKVTITDASGQLLWPQSAGGAGGGSRHERAGSRAALRPERPRRASTRCSPRRSGRARRRCSSTPT